MFSNHHATSHRRLTIPEADISIAVNGGYTLIPCSSTPVEVHREELEGTIYDIHAEELIKRLHAVSKNYKQTEHMIGILHKPVQEMGWILAHSERSLAKALLL